MTRRANFDWTALYKQAVMIHDSATKAVAAVPQEEIDDTLRRMDFLQDWFAQVYRGLWDRQFLTTAPIKPRGHLRRIK